MKGFHPFKLPTFTVIAKSYCHCEPKAWQSRWWGTLRAEVASGLTLLAMTKERGIAMARGQFAMTGERDGNGKEGR